MQNKEEINCEKCGDTAETMDEQKRKRERDARNAEWAKVNMIQMV
jgi:hypothetical protein